MNDSMLKNPNDTMQQNTNDTLLQSTNGNKILRIIRSLMLVLSKIHAVMLLALPAPVLCLTVSGRSDVSICRLYLAGGILIICSAAADFAGRRLKSFGAYLACCLLAAIVMLCGAYALGTRLFSPGFRNGFLAEMMIAAFILITTSARLRMREKLRQKAKEENDISWVEHPVALEKPSIFGVLWLAAAYLISVLTNCPAFCNLMLLSCVLYSLILLAYTCLHSILSYFLEVRHLTHVPSGKIFRQSILFLSLLAALILLCAVPAALTRGKRLYQDIRSMEIHWVISPEDMSFPDADHTPPSIIPHELIEKGERHPTPVWLIYLGHLLTGAVLLLLLIQIIRLVIGYAHRFRGRAEEENGDIAVSLEEDKAVRLQRFAAARRTGRNLTESEKIRREYRRVIRKYRRGRDLPAACETPTQIEEGTAFPEGYKVEELHEAYILARYGKPAKE